jgi:UDP-4-amino-4,6-dideoxy-N-acetyl-beta-L-altrosamine N-acetyltransferase
MNESELRLRMLTRADLPALLSWRNSEAVQTMMFSSRPISMAEHERWFQRVAEDSARHVLVMENDAQLLGTINFVGNRHSASVLDWGFFKNPAAPKGTGHRLGVLGLNWVFSNTTAHKIVGEVLAFNKGSQRFHQRLGFVQEGLLREQYQRDGQWTDVVCYGLLKREWCDVEVIRDGDTDG